MENTGNEYIGHKIVEFTEYNLEKIVNEGEENINIIFDSFSFYFSLNIQLGELKRLINLIYEATKSLNCISFLYGIRETHDKRLENKLLKSCDVIFDITVEKSSDTICNCLSIPKIRCGLPVTDKIRFKYADGVQIDTAKDIA